MRWAFCSALDPREFKLPSLFRHRAASQRVLSFVSMPPKPEMSRPEMKGDITLDPFQLESLRVLLLEHEEHIKAHMDHKMEELSRSSRGSKNIFHQLASLLILL